jgi:hypothetical protein
MTAIAASAASLTGLLFVALSVARRPDRREGPVVIEQVRAAAALLAFSNALAISLFGLVPGTHVGYPAAVMGIVGLFFTAASLRTIVSSRATTGLRLGQAGLILLLLLIFGTELGYGIAALLHPKSSQPVEFISYALVTSVLVGIARAWELVSDRDTGIIASIAVLARHEHEHEHEHKPRPPRPAGQPATGPAGIPDGDTPGGGADGHGPDAHDPHYPDAQDTGSRPG